MADRQLLDRHLAVQHPVAGPPDGAHPAAAQPLAQLVPPGQHPLGRDGGNGGGSGSGSGSGDDYGGGLGLGIWLWFDNRLGDRLGLDGGIRPGPGLLLSLAPGRPHGPLPGYSLGLGLNLGLNPGLNLGLDFDFDSGPVLSAHGDRPLLGAPHN